MSKLVPPLLVNVMFSNIAEHGIDYNEFSDRRVPPGPVIFVHQEAADQRDEVGVLRV